MSNSHNVQNWRTRTKAKLVQAFGGGCAKCDYDTCHAGLSFHHINEEEKSFGIAHALSKIKSWKAIKEEAMKCVMLCNNCHSEHHEGLFEIDETFKRFDETLINEESMYDKCICGNEKNVTRKYCSRKCAANKRIDWVGVDILEIYDRLGSYNAVGRELGVSGSSVRKRILKVRRQGDNRYAVNVD